MQEKLLFEMVFENYFMYIPLIVLTGVGMFLFISLFLADKEKEKRIKKLLPSSISKENIEYIMSLEDFNVEELLKLLSQKEIEELFFNLEKLSDTDKLLFLKELKQELLQEKQEKVKNIINNFRNNKGEA